MVLLGVVLLFSGPKAHMLSLSDKRVISVCLYSGSVLRKDVTQHCKDVLALLRHAKSTRQRVTALKLLDAWQGKGPPTLRVSLLSGLVCLSG